jgi:hypothetical protein
LIELRQIVEQLAATAETMGQEVTGTALAIMAEDLSRFNHEDVMSGLVRVRRECTRMTLAAIIERMPNMWPGANEAWAAFPKDEADSGVVTGEALRAWGIALSLWEHGDKIGARMAFIDAYRREVSQAATAQPVWTVTIGHDVTGREHVIRRGIEQGKIEADKAQHLIPQERYDDHGHVVGLITGKVSNLPVDNDTRARLGEIKAMIEKTKSEQKAREQAERRATIAMREKERQRQLEAARVWEREHMTPEHEAKARQKLIDNLS